MPGPREAWRGPRPGADAVRARGLPSRGAPPPAPDWAAAAPIAADRAQNDAAAAPGNGSTRGARVPKRARRPLAPSPSQLLALLWLVIEDHDNLFVLAEAVHAAGIGLLCYKLAKKRNCGGLSLQSQYLTAAFLGVRLLCSFMMEYDIHTLLDFITLAATCWVIYELAVPLADTYQADQDALPWWLVAAPCLACALVAHPSTHHPLPFRVLWATCVYMEAVSVLPQLRMMQKVWRGRGEWGLGWGFLVGARARAALAPTAPRAPLLPSLPGARR